MQRPGRTIRHARRRGLSLAELMIAIGILGMGLIGAAAMLPTGILESRNAVNDLYGSLVCRNGLAMAQTQLTHPLFGGETNTLVPIQAALSERDGRFAYRDGEENRAGFVLLARQFEPATDVPNDYQFVTVAYEKFDPNSEIRLARVSGNLSEADDKKRSVLSGVSITNGSEVSGQVLQVNAVLIEADTGRYAFIQKLENNGNRALLDRKLQGSDFWMVVETNNSGAVNSPTSPVLSALATRTSLREP